MRTPHHGAPGETRGKVYRFLVSHLAARGYAPSCREIGEALGLSSTATVQYHLRALEREGLIEHPPERNRATTVKVKPGCCPTCGQVKP